MQIDSIDLYHVALPLVNPQTSKVAGIGEIGAAETILVRMASGETAGWGEASPGTAPLAGADFADGVFACLKRWLAPAVAGKSIESGEALSERLAPWQGNRFAKAALDTAWWDLEARRQGKPLHQLLDPRRETVEVGPTFDQMDSIDELLAAIHAAVDAGFSRVKLMFRPGWDVQMVDFVVKEFPTLTVAIDCEGALNLGHWEMLCRLDDFGLAMMEQPLPAVDFVGHAQIQDTLRTPVCLDESISTLDHLEVALDVKSCKYVNLEPGRVGGLTPAVAMHDTCHEACVACYVGAVPRSAIGTRIALALATKANCDYPADYFPVDSLLAEDLAPAPVPQKGDDGIARIPLWTEPGLGIEPDMELLEKLCVDQAHVG